MQNITVPDYYPKFKCIGPDCEDSCCSSWWNVSIDHDTFKKYEQITQPELAPFFKLALNKNTSPNADNQNNYGLLKMKPDGGCYFLQENKLCAIHQHLGAQALSDTCRIYPRYLNQFGSHREHSLGISCPEAARIILLNPEPMKFCLIEHEPTIDDKLFTSYRFPLQNEGDPKQIAILDDFRAVIIAILQFREITLGARMMLLGFLMEDIDRIIFSENFSHAAEVLPTLETYVGMLSNPEDIEAQFSNIEPSIPRKIDMVMQFITLVMNKSSTRYQACLQAAFEGLESIKAGPETLPNYTKNAEKFYQPFLNDKDYIFENYLVNQVVSRLIPFTRGTYLNLFRELVGNLSVLQVLLFGMSVKNKGLNTDLVVQLFQTFARNSNHNSAHQDNLISSMHASSQDSFVSVMWMLKVK